jgi:hypothetical protein
MPSYIIEVQKTPSRSARLSSVGRSRLTAGSSRSAEETGSFRERDRGFESAFLQRGSLANLTSSIRAPNSATGSLITELRGPSRVTAVANLLMTPIGLTLRPPMLLASQPHFNRRYHGAYNDQLARNATSR